MNFYEYCYQKQISSSQCFSLLEYWKIRNRGFCFLFKHLPTSDDDLDQSTCTLRPTRSKSSFSSFRKPAPSARPPPPPRVSAVLSTSSQYLSASHQYLPTVDGSSTGSETTIDGGGENTSNFAASVPAGVSASNVELSAKSFASGLSNLPSLSASCQQLPSSAFVRQQSCRSSKMSSQLSRHSLDGGSIASNILSPPSLFRDHSTSLKHKRARPTEISTPKIARLSLETVFRLLAKILGASSN